MNNNTFKKALSFTKGLTNSPSDFVSTDDELTESVGMIMKNGEMMPIQRPAYLNMLNTDETLVYVHKGAEYCNHVTFNKKTKELSFYFWNEDRTEITETQKVTLETDVHSVASVGNFCVVSTDNDRLYLLFKKGTYIMLGELPDLELNFLLSQDGDTLDFLKKYSDAANFVDIANFSPKYIAVYSANSNMSFWELKAVYQSGHESMGVNDNKTEYCYITNPNNENIQKACEGNVAKMWQTAKKKNYFLHPFFVRYAFKLFDGTYARISNPIAVFPSVSRTGYLTPVSWSGAESKFSFAKIDSKLYSLNAPKYKLCYSILSNLDLEVWSDIIKEIVVFASDDVTLYKTDTQFDYIENPIDSQGLLVSDCVGDISSQEGVNTIEWRYGGKNASDKLYARPIFVPKEYKTEQEIIDEMLTKTQFYKLFSVRVNKAQSNIQSEAPIKTGVLENLETQEQLQNDDYYGWTKMVNEKSFSYNRRLNLIGVKRYPFSGFPVFIASGNISDLFSYYVHIVSDTIDAWVKKDNSNASIYTTNSWFYYPDPNATEVIFYNNNTKEAQKIQLLRHPFLNGAYAFNYLPNKKNFSPGNADDGFDDTEIKIPNVDPNAYEDLSSQIFTSIVNNPLVFQADGDNTIGTGSILGVAANTEPVSQGQFGQYPLIVFTTEGIYGLSVTAEGLYAASFPISREVCNNINSVTPTGKLIFFTSEKGLMAISGNTAQYLSSQLSGSTSRNFNIVGDSDFRTFTKDALLAYDYRDSLIRIYSPTHTYHYVYNMNDQTFAKAYNENTTVIAAVSSYPDHLVQEADGKVYSMLSKPDINADTRTYSGIFITRPLKLGSSIELKTIHQILHFFNSDKGTMQLQISASNDCRTWRELKSLHGKPWIFYVFRYKLSNLKAIDSFSGTALAVETRFNDKMR